MAAEHSSLFQFYVEGVEEQTTALRTTPRAFNETYKVEGEHPAHALEKLVRNEIEWGILDASYGFTITFLPEADDDE